MRLVLDIMALVTVMAANINVFGFFIIMCMELYYNLLTFIPFIYSSLREAPLQGLCHTN